MSPGPQINYRQVRRINAPAARQAVLDHLRSNGHNVAQAVARSMGQLAC